MTGSKADRPYGSFLKPGPVPAAEARPPRWRQRLAARLGRLRARVARAELVVIGAVIALLSVIVAQGLAPTGAPLTQRDVDRAIAKALGSATPKPNVAVAAYANVRKSVVQVRTRTDAEPAASPRAAGVVLDQGGSILTSLHAIRDAAEIRVVFFDGSESLAFVANAQLENDVALLEPLTPPLGLVPATLSSPKALRMGDEAIVVGSPFGLADSVSAGVVSGFGRTFQASWQPQPLHNLVQFDAAVNPGSLGGALVNRRGEVVGIVIAFANPSGANVFAGVGFAIPVDSAANAAGSVPF